MWPHCMHSKYLILSHQYKFSFCMNKDHWNPGVCQYLLFWVNPTKMPQLKCWHVVFYCSLTFPHQTMQTSSDFSMIKHFYGDVNYRLWWFISQPWPPNSAGLCSKTVRLYGNVERYFSPARGHGALAVDYFHLQLNIRLLLLSHFTAAGWGI